MKSRPRGPRARISEVRRDEPSSRDANGRQIIQCSSCGRTDISEAAHELCFTCYRRQKRSQSRHITLPAQRAEQIRLTKLYGQIMTAVIGLGMSDEHQRQLQRLIAPYLELVPNLLSRPDDGQIAAPPVQLLAHEPSTKVEQLKEASTSTPEERL